MDDLIRRKDAIKAVESLPNCYNGFSETYDKACFIGVLEEVPATSTCKFWNSESNYCALYRPSAQPEQRWIPCSERMPKKADGEYWVCTDTGYQCQCRWTDDVYGLGSSGEWAWKIFDIPQYSHVIAWMPLPKPWRGGAK